MMNKIAHKAIILQVCVFPFKLTSKEKEALRPMTLTNFISFPGSIDWDAFMAETKERHQRMLEANRKHQEARCGPAASTSNAQGQKSAEEDLNPEERKVISSPLTSLPSETGERLSASKATSTLKDLSASKKKKLQEGAALPTGSGQNLVPHTAGESSKTVSN